jgi:hypothetical protein
MAPLAETLTRLCALSRRTFRNPYTWLVFPEELNRTEWFTSPELISLYPTPVWDGLSDEQRRVLSFWEAVNFYSLNIHGEKTLMEGVARVLYRRDLLDATDYLHHILDEENKHSIYFGTFCRRYAGKIYPDRKLAFPRHQAAGEETFLFFAMVLVFEEIVDAYNATMGKDNRLNAVARRINTNHHAEETRHLRFGRQLVQELWRQGAHEWPADTIARVRAHLESYLRAAWGEYYNPDAYRDAGLDDPWEIRNAAWSDPNARQHRRAVSAGCVRFLVDSGVLEKEPVL